MSNMQLIDTAYGRPMTGHGGPMTGYGGPMTGHGGPMTGHGGPISTLVYCVTLQCSVGVCYAPISRSVVSFRLSPQ